MLAVPLPLSDKTLPMQKNADPTAIAVVLKRALELHQAGHAAEALDLLHTVVKRYPNAAQAHLILGQLQAASGAAETAVQSYDRALSLQPDYPEAHYSRGNALQELKRHADAVASYDAVLKRVPNRPEVLANRGNALHDLKRYEAALSSYDQALALMPDVAMLHNNRGNTLRDLKRYAEALASLDKALALEPGYADALINRGNVLQDLGRYEEALAAFDNVLARQPEHLAALNNRGNVLHDLKRYEAAIASYDWALRVNPAYAEALNNRGIALLRLRRPDEALASFDRALALDPEYAEAFNNTGNALRDLRRFEGALASFDRALVIEPDYPEALYNQGHVLNEMKQHEAAAAAFARLLKIAPDSDYALGDMLCAQLSCCDWTAYAHTVERIAAAVREGRKADDPFPFLAISESAADQLMCARSYAADKYPAPSTPLWTGKRYRHDRIRVAYLSADYREHALSYLMAGLFERHDRARFETIGISFRPQHGSAMALRIKSAFECFIDVSARSDREVAQLLHDLEVDIAVDLMGFTVDCRTGILAHRAAPIQVNYLGYPGTMGAEYIDYILADRHVIRPEHHAYYTEKVVVLPDTYQANDSRRSIAHGAPTRAECGLPPEGFVFCCFNNNYKIAPPIFDIWMRLLRQIEGSVLWIVDDNPTAVRNLRLAAEQRGVVPQRLVFAPRIKLEDHLARQRLADLFLDTLPYNAHTTASDALWAGLPVLTCMGQTFAGRVAASLLHAVGLPELITGTLEEYEVLALKLARDPELLANIKSKLARHRTTHALFDTDRFRRHIEAAYIGMWERYQRGEPPQSFTVEPIANP
ncbi:MAG: tetratricopeptide repeat protein [Burkholderiales bacterium]